MINLQLWMLLAFVWLGLSTQMPNYIPWFTVLKRYERVAKKGKPGMHIGRSVMTVAGFVHYLILSTMPALYIFKLDPTGSAGTLEVLTGAFYIVYLYMNQHYKTYFFVESYYGMAALCVATSGGFGIGLMVTFILQAMWANMVLSILLFLWSFWRFLEACYWYGHSDHKSMKETAGHIKWWFAGKEPEEQKAQEAE